MIGLVEGAIRQRTPNEIALSILLAGLSVVFVVVTASLVPMAHYAGAGITLAVLASLFVALIPTTIGALLSAIGIAGMNRLVRKQRARHQRPRGGGRRRRSVLLLDKTGTITLGNRQAPRFLPVDGRRRARAGRGRAALVAGRRDARGPLHRRAREGALRASASTSSPSASARFIPFTAETRMSGVDLDGRELRKGAADAVRRYVQDDGGQSGRRRSTRSSTSIARAGATPLVVADGTARAGRDRAQGHRQGGHPRALRPSCAPPGIRTVMITGDNPLTAAAIAAEAGVDDFLAEATPEAKLALIRERAGRRAAGGDDRRRHQRRAGAGAGRRRRRDERGHARRRRRPATWSTSTRTRPS